MTDSITKHDRGPLSNAVGAFVGSNAGFYERAFAKIEAHAAVTFTWNSAAAIFGPLWGAARHLWSFFWIFLPLELFALVQIGRGLWGELGADQRQRYEKLVGIIAEREQSALDAIALGDNAGAESALNIAKNLKLAAAQAQDRAHVAAADAVNILVFGLLLLLLIKTVEGLYANYAYEKQYLRWRTNPALPTGTSRLTTAFGVLLLLAIWPITIYRFTTALPIDIVINFPFKKEVFSPTAVWLESRINWLAVEFSSVFKSITILIRMMLDAFEVILVDTPWPVVMLLIIVLAFRLAGPRVTAFVVAALAYLAFFGLWQMSMITVALLGTSAILCLIFGIPLGIWFGKSPRAYSFASPALDFMQTMPAFVYLIPIIAFFGTGKPPAVLATIIFAMPPVIRLTALGMRQVPEGTKEAATAFGCTRWQLLWYVEVPLAMPSILTGVNQTILMCLSMVVIASLIGAGGLGASILEALQYAAKGQGLLAGLAILFCAMVIDRIVRGLFPREHRA